MNDEEPTWKSPKTIHIDPILHKELKAYATKKKQSIQEVANTGLRDYLNRKKLQDFF